MNKVVAGDYKGKGVSAGFKCPVITLPMFKTIKLNADTVSIYEVLNQDTRMSSSSAVGRAIVGSAILGPIGIAAAMGAKNKENYMIAIQFKDGKKSLLEVDKSVYKALIKSLFEVKIAQWNPEVTEQRSELKLKESPVSPNDSQITQKTKRVKITRKPRALACGAVYEIKCDGDTVGFIKNGKEAEFFTSVGEHKLTVLTSAMKNKIVGELLFAVPDNDLETELSIETISLNKISIGKVSPN